MHGLFGEIQISEKAHQRRQNSARFRSVKSLNGPAQVFGHGRRHLRQTSKWSGSTQPRSGFSYPHFRATAAAFFDRDQAQPTMGVEVPHSRTFSVQRLGLALLVVFAGEVHEDVGYLLAFGG